MSREQQETFHRMIGERVQVARKEAGLTQEALSDRLGFKDRQILSNIESGKRKVSTDEMLTLMKHLGKDLEYFTDPLILVGEGSFCWRAEAGPDVLDAFEEKAKGWLAFYRTIGEDLGEAGNPLAFELKLTSRSSYEEAQEAGETLVREWRLGESPAKKLPEIAERELGILLLHIDPPGDISGAACRLREFNTILINRNDPEGRRAYDSAHELFHLLTWRDMPPERIELPVLGKAKKNRVEQLADNFAAALLMPRSIVMKHWNARGEKDIHRRIIGLAEEFGVTAEALYWRLRALELLSEGDAVKISRSRFIGQPPPKGERPKLFSKPFVERLWKGLMKGLISERRAAALLDGAFEKPCTFEDLTELFEAYGMKSPLEI